ncbi:MAG: hypothetical protein ABI867_45070, partial [Kofleriaceae bacterium]
MAKPVIAVDDVGKPGKPPRYRKFPWRLWLWALVMTAAAGAGGYFAWFFRGESIESADTAKAATDKLAIQTGELTRKTSDAATCATEREKDAVSNKKLSEEHKELSKNLNASKEELTQ